MELPADVPISSELRGLIDQAFAAWRVANERIEQEQRGKNFIRALRPLPPDATDRFCLLVGPAGEKVTSQPHDDAILNLFNLWGLDKERAAIQSRMLGHPDLTLWHLLRGRRPRDNSVRASRAASIFWNYASSSALRERLKSGSGLSTSAKPAWP